ncbi:bacteriorhodopsin [Salinarimonas soli]|uniref:Rhodopsin n=1 Tax=Salinarimonas soli TaxID=1638099 RepID=A0A5B2VFD4_9HYPH|nr:bacteriorhodopsin [Salinarimonas soli]KAA2237575.1 rhodopsin [Salinarimonas soli]
MNPRPIEPATEAWLWVGVAGMALAAIVMLAFVKRARTPFEESQAVSQFFVLLIAFGTYLAMALGQGSLTADDGRQVFVSRYITWTFTTPLLLLGLATTALGSPITRRKPVVAGLIGADIIMILTGLVAALSPSGSHEKWIWYGVSSGAFLAVYYLICGPLLLEARVTGADHRRLYLRNAVVLSVIWFLYPVNFLLGNEGLGQWGGTATTAIYTLLDLASKAAYGFFAITGVRALTDRAGAPALTLDEAARRAGGTEADPARSG